MKLDLGCGNNPADGFEGVDLYAPNAKHQVNLFEFPWPFATDSVEEIRASHFIEHIPMCCKSGRIIPANMVDKDLMVAFFDECYRILQPGGKIQLIWPALQSVRAFQDPTHRRFIPTEFLWYLSKEWRKANGLEHYLGECDFETQMCTVQIAPMLETNGEFRTVEAITQAVALHWNLAVDYIATLVAKKVA